MEIEINYFSHTHRPKIDRLTIYTDPKLYNLFSNLEKKYLKKFRLVHSINTFLSTYKYEILEIWNGKNIYYFFEWPDGDEYSRGKIIPINFSKYSPPLEDKWIIKK